MPIFTIWTNVSRLPAEFLTRTPKFIASVTGKPEGAIMCIAHSGQAMSYAGTEMPTACISFASIGIINSENNKKFSAEFCDYFSKELDVEKSRILIKFENLQGSDVGWNGTTRA